MHVSTLFLIFCVLYEPTLTTEYNYLAFFIRIKVPLILISKKKADMLRQEINLAAEESNIIACRKTAENI